MTLSIFCVFQCLVLKSGVGETVGEIQSKGRNQVWNWGTLLQSQTPALNI